ncbi:MAG: ATP cone domain-containing protein [Chloroflexota bacterium]
MRCPYCADGESRVLDSREVGRGVRRRRVCQACGQRFTTYEGQPAPTFTVLKRDGRLEGYNRAKLLKSLRAVCYKRSTVGSAIEEVVDRIEADLSRSSQTTVASRQIAELALAELSGLDEVAYLWYASGVRGFRGAEELVAELDVLRSLRRRYAESRVQMRLQFDLDQPHWN